MRYSSGLIRERLLQAATELFLDRGFEGTSMMEVSARAGGSKQTLYNHFADKGALFSAVMLRSIEMIGPAPADLLEGEEPLLTRMSRFANARFAQVARPFALSLRRVLLADAVRVVEGPRLHGLFFEAPWAPVAARFEAMIARGELKPGCSRLMAKHFRNLLEFEIMPQLVMGAPLDLDDDPAASAVEAFLSAYAARW
jgi:AcrR family transcriptional regulator